MTTTCKDRRSEVSSRDPYLLRVFARMLFVHNEKVDAAVVRYYYADHVAGLFVVYLRDRYVRAPVLLVVVNGLGSCVVT